MALRKPPYAFTQEGVAMLAGILRSPRAVQTSIYIVRAFIRMRELIAANHELADRVERLERGQDHVTSAMEVLVADIDRLVHEVEYMQALPEPKQRPIGFQAAGG